MVRRVIRMRRIAGIDFSLTATGIGIITQRVSSECSIATSTIRSKGSAGDTLISQWERLDRVTREVASAACQPELAVVESPSFASKSRDIDRLWAAWWMLIGRLHALEIPVATVSPTSLKLAITGKGTVDKSVLGGHIVRLWPELEYANDNEADGAGLAHVGAVTLGWNVKTLQRHREIKWTEWPEFGPEMRVVS